MQRTSGGIQCGSCHHLIGTILSWGQRRRQHVAAPEENAVTPIMPSWAEQTCCTYTLLDQDEIKPVQVWLVRLLQKRVKKSDFIWKAENFREWLRWAEHSDQTLVRWTQLSSVPVFTGNKGWSKDGAKARWWQDVIFAAGQLEYETWNVIITANYAMIHGSGKHIITSPRWLIEDKVKMWETNSRINIKTAKGEVRCGVSSASVRVKTVVNVLAIFPYWVSLWHRVSSSQRDDVEQPFPRFTQWDR